MVVSIDPEQFVLGPCQTAARSLRGRNFESLRESLPAALALRHRPGPRRLADLCAISPDTRRAMGAAARQRICSLCDDNAVLEARLEHFRSLRAPAPAGCRSRVPVISTGCRKRP